MLLFSGVPLMALTCGGLLYFRSRGVQFTISNRQPTLLYYLMFLSNLFPSVH